MEERHYGNEDHRHRKRHPGRGTRTGRRRNRPAGAARRRGVCSRCRRMPHAAVYARYRPLGQDRLVRRPTGNGSSAKKKDHSGLSYFGIRRRRQQAARRSGEVARREHPLEAQPGRTGHRPRTHPPR
ncbi:hypothetical protein RHCRD62_60146 [Rhodococcus sp. RD6.2]|nr:hypothetical protein RHCRD62_60146 [Rhodococcus sp. RD6.2]